MSALVTPQWYETRATVAALCRWAAKRWPDDAGLVAEIVTAPYKWDDLQAHSTGLHEGWRVPTCVACKEED